MDDAEAVVSVCDAGTPQVEGRYRHTVERRVTHWQRSGFSLEDDTRVAQDAHGQVVGYAAIYNPVDPSLRIRGELYLLPNHETPELASPLLEWLESRTRDLASTTSAEAQAVMVHHAFSRDAFRRRLLLDRGYRLIHHALRLRIDLSQPPAVHVPKGISIRAVDPAKDLPAVSRTVQEAFRHHWGFIQRPQEADVARYRTWLAEDPGIDPSLWHLAHAGKEAVGVCLGTARYSGDPGQAYIFTLGVRDAWRGQGIGRALLLHAFAAFRESGSRYADLDVDTANLTGALRLYERAGMRVCWQMDEYEKEILSSTSSRDVFRGHNTK